jgi:chromosome segregation ATPase
MNTSIKQTRETIEGYEKRIEAENNKSAVLSQGKQEETSQKLRQAKQDVQDAEQRVKDVADQKRKKMAEADGLKADIQKIESTIVDAQQRIMAINETLGRLAQKAKDQYIAYGNNIQAVLEEIKKTPWKGDIVGPLGLHVKVKDPETWAPLIRSLLGSHMTSFAVTNSQDREKLKALLKRHRKCVGQISQTSSARLRSSFAVPVSRSLSARRTCSTIAGVNLPRICSRF